LRRPVRRAAARAMQARFPTDSKASATEVSAGAYLLPRAYFTEGTGR
jgi:hypothetical protein